MMLLLTTPVLPPIPATARADDGDQGAMESSPIHWIRDPRYVISLPEANQWPNSSFKPSAFSKKNLSTDSLKDPSHVIAKPQMQPQIISSHYHHPWIIIAANHIAHNAFPDKTLRRYELRSDFYPQGSLVKGPDALNSTRRDGGLALLTGSPRVIAIRFQQIFLGDSQMVLKLFNPIHRFCSHGTASP